MSARSIRSGRSVRTFLTTRIVEVLGICLLVAGLAACATSPIPLSAQIGSTIVLPVGNQDQDVGYGGSDYTDYQRGMMVYQLQGTDPLVELTTRVSLAAMPAPASLMAQKSGWDIGDFWSVPRQFFSLVDLTPSNGTTISEGTYTIRGVWRRDGEADVPLADFGPRIKILPASIDVVGPAGPETIVGAPTPPPQGQPERFARAIPRPRIGILLLPIEVRAFELELKYPEDVVDVVDVVYRHNSADPPNGAPILWFDDDEATGTVKIDGVVHPKCPNPGAAGLFGLAEIEVVFELIDGATQILEYPHAGLFVKEGTLVAYDHNGSPLGGASATLQGIR